MAQPRVGRGLALSTSAVLMGLTFAAPSRAQPSRTGQRDAGPSAETPVAVEVVGRLSVEWTDRELLADGSERSSGMVLDELGEPVPATLIVTAPPGARLTPCAGGPQPPDSRYTTSSDGRFCFVGPSAGSELGLRIEAMHHESASVVAPPPSALGPRILRAPRSIDLDSPTSATFEILPASTSRAGQVALWVECGAEPVRLHEAPSNRGLVRAEVEPALVPGPGACTVFAEQVPGAATNTGEQERALRSRSHPLLAVAKAALELQGTSVEDEATVVSVAVTAGPVRKKLDAGVVEVWQGDAFVASAPIAAGEATVSIPHAQKPATARISLADGGPGVISGAAIELPIATVAKETSRSALVGWLVFGALGVWLVWLWLGRGRRDGARVSDRALPAGLEFAPPEASDRDGRISGRVYDANTAEALAGVRVLLQIPDATSIRLVAETRTTSDGSFRFEERLDAAAMRRLRFECDGYVPQEGRVTSARVSARLVSLRHALLGALFTRGQAMTKRAARVTPSELARIAAHHGNVRLSRWALAIERAVYGPHAPSRERAEVLLAGDDPGEGEPPEPMADGPASEKPAQAPARRSV